MTAETPPQILEMTNDHFGPFQVEDLTHPDENQRIPENEGHRLIRSFNREAAFSKVKTFFQSLNPEIAYPGRFPNELNGAGLCWEVMEGRGGVVRRWWSGAEMGRSGAMESGGNS
nr:hypothetical protein [Tanacetum cinerariifolium]